MRNLAPIVFALSLSGVVRADVSAPPPPPATASATANACPKGARMRALFEPAPRPAGSAAASIPPSRAREIVVEELTRAGLTPSDEPLFLPGVARIDELRRYYSRELREKQNLPLHSNELINRPVQLDAFVAGRGVGFLVLGSYLELAVHRGLPRSDGAARADDWRPAVHKRLLAAADGEPRLRALFLLGDPGYDREDELRRLVREALTCLPPK